MAEAESREHIADLIAPLRVRPGATVSLKHDFDPDCEAPHADKHRADDILRADVAILEEYQERLAAEGARALLVVVQALDAAGKDGTIRHVMSGVNPQGVEVHSFKQPSVEERAHDYLWRYQKALPQRGTIGIFNRSHYEEVLVVRVHPENLVQEHLPSSSQDEDVWARRFREINQWERYLVENGIHIVKLCLHVSKEEQRERFLARIQEQEKNWKFSASDVRERQYWDEYQKAYDAVLSNTSTDWAPWYVIPADHKWFMRVASAAVILDALMAIDPQYPTVSPDEREELQREGKMLEAEKD